MNWYYVDNGKQAGPVEDAQLEELRRTGSVQSDTLVWREGMAEWKPYSEAFNPAKPPVAAPPVQSQSLFSEGSDGEPTQAVCTECHGIFSKDNMIRHGNAHVCANCKPAFLQKLSEGAKINTGELPYAGFWIRFAAKFVDGLIIGVPFMVVFILLVMSRGRSFERNRFEFLPLLIQLCFVALNMTYQVYFLGKYGATLGKMACKLKVVTSDGSKISYGRAAGRFFAELLSAMICDIGYIIAGFDKEKRALHDHICNTRVIYTDR